MSPKLNDALAKQDCHPAFRAEQLMSLAEQSALGPPQLELGRKAVGDIHRPAIIPKG